MRSINLKEEGKRRVVLIISISSDIGYAMAQRYAHNGYQVIGTYRSKDFLKKTGNIPNSKLFRCDISDKRSVNRFIEDFKKLKLNWDLIISCPSNPLPVRAFFDCDFEDWKKSINVNVTEQLEILHKLYQFRNKEKIPSVIFFSGAGSSSTVINFSAYSASKVMLMKMCELLDAENRDLKVIIIGPGWVKTKIHKTIFDNMDKNDPKYAEIKEFIENKKGTDIDEIFKFIRWLEKQEKEVVGGRNFSINDNWRGAKEQRLINELKSDKNMYKLRRYKTNFN